MRTILILTALGASCTLMACGTPGFGGSGSRGGGADATGMQGAQNVGRDQGTGQAPLEQVGANIHNEYRLASDINPEVAKAILEIAADEKWTPEQLTSAMRAAAGAPESIVIGNIDTSATIGNQEAIGAASGAGGGATGSRTAERP